MPPESPSSAAGVDRGQRRARLRLCARVTTTAWSPPGRDRAARKPGRPAAGAGRLFEAPDSRCPCRSSAPATARRETIRDLTAHPWAGAKVKMTLVARDEADQEGRSEPVELTLPARRFTRPARQRRGRAAAQAGDGRRDARRRCRGRLDALTLAPEDTSTTCGDLSGRCAAPTTASSTRATTTDLRDVVDYSGGRRSASRTATCRWRPRRPRDAQEALCAGARERRLRRGDRRAHRTSLRQAMQEFLQAMAAGGAAQPQHGATCRRPQRADAPLAGPRPHARPIEKLARNGAKDAARQMLSELQNMLENLQAGRPMQGDQQAGDQMMQSLNELADMIRRQQELMDETHRAERGHGQDGEPRAPRRRPSELGQLQQGQGGCAGAGGADGADGAGRAARTASSARPARRWARRKARSARATARQAVGKQGERARRSPPAAASPWPIHDRQRRDSARASPGRAASERGSPRPPAAQRSGLTSARPSKVPDEIDIQRAREILEELRRRLSDPARPRLERDYLERLLERF